MVQGQRHAGDRGAGGGGDGGVCAAGCGLSGLLRRKNAVLPAVRAGGGGRSAGHRTVPPAGAEAGSGVPYHPGSGDGAGVHHAGGLHAADQRHGAADVSAPELVRAGEHRPDEMDGADVHPAKLRRQSGRYADALRQSPEPVSVQLLQHPQRGVPVHHAAAVPAVHGADFAVLPVPAAGEPDRSPPGDAAGQAPRRDIRRAVLRGGGYGAAGHPLLAGAARHRGGAAGAGSPGAAGRGLGTAGDIRGVLHLLRQHGADRAGASDVPPAADPRGHAGGGADQSGHQQCAGGHPAEPVHR